VSVQKSTFKLSLQVLMTSNQIIFGSLIVTIIVAIWWLYSARQLDTFCAGNAIVVKSEILGKNCQIDTDCGQGNFCYNGKCWSFWPGINMPWSSCRAPYCGSTDPNLKCHAAGGNGCISPYCKCQVVTQPGGSLAMEPIPACGSICLTNSDCPQGCPECSRGVCSVPTQSNIL
jgi:hypothetical protein